MRGTSTFIIVLNTKFCTPCVHFAPSAAFRFLLIDWMLVLNARSNLSAFTTSNVPDHSLLLALTSLYPAILGVILQTMVLTHNACEKSGFMLIFTPTFVPGLTTKLVIGLELYILRFCSCRVQERNPGAPMV